MSELLEADDVANLLGMSRDWVYAEARAGRIPRFRRESIDLWIVERERGTIAPTS